MTVIGEQVSSLRAAREWRGITLVAAARASGLGVLQAEALEQGQADQFASIDEMIAAAVLYGSSLGVGRDEAMALLDRTMTRTDEQLPRTTQSELTERGGTSDFSAAVRRRSAAMEITQAGISIDDSDISEVAMPASAFDNMSGYQVEVEAETTGDLPVVSVVPEDSPVHTALGLDHEYRAAWEQAHSDFAEWSADRSRGLPAHGGITARVRPGVTRLFGERRSEPVMRGVERSEIAVRNGGRAMRAWLHRSEHATLIVAVGVGILLLAILIGVASSMNSPAPAPQPKSQGAPQIVAPGEAASEAAQASTSADTDKQQDAKSAAAPPARPTVTPVLPPAQIRLQVLNAGRKKGYAKQIADKLKSRGYRIDTVGNSKTPYGSSVILYPAALEREAGRLSRQAGITTMDTLPPARAKGNSMIIVVQ
jgi:hypothetical protein